MPVTKKSQAESSPLPMSFRLPPETVIRLRAIGEYSGRSLAEVVQILIGDEFDRLMKQEPKEMAAADRKVRREFQGRRG